ncbi:MAG: YicC family protein [Candidatus Omnitrophica bacterium]|nr:YicC family protein [Candidatus Omnitrophota bacterium]
MLKSMTGYGRAERIDKSGAFIVEARSLNHKFLDISVRLPETLSALEEEIKTEVRRLVRRGKLTVSVVFKPSERALAESIQCDMAAIRQIHNLLVKIKKALRLEDEIVLADILALSNSLITYSKTTPDTKKVWTVLKKTVQEAVKALIAMREKEGEALTRDIINHCSTVARRLQSIESRTDVVTRSYKARLQQRIRELHEPKRLVLDEGRIETECALLARNSDISEEVVRLKSHIAGLEEFVRQGKEVGRQIDFLAQEMTREINTICQKANDYSISRSGITIKSAIEKIREQVQNVE